MYVCLCNGYRDAEIREVAAETGERCAKEVYLSLGNGPCCGTCIDCAQEIVNDVHAPAAARADNSGRPQPRMTEALLMAAE